MARKVRLFIENIPFSDFEMAEDPPKGTIPSMSCVLRGAGKNTVILLRFEAAIDPTKPLPDPLDMGVVKAVTVNNEEYEMMQQAFEKEMK